MISEIIIQCDCFAYLFDMCTVPRAFHFSFRNSSFDELLVCILYMCILFSCGAVTVKYLALYCITTYANYRGSGCY